MTWTQLQATAPQPPPNDFPWSSVNRISIDPNNPDKLLAATSGGIRRSEDGGDSWTLELTADKSLYVAFDPAANNKAVAEIFVDPSPTISGDEYHRAVYSTDGGESWQNSSLDGNEFKRIGSITPSGSHPGGSRRIELAYSRSSSSPNTVYALHPEGIARSTDGGATFTTRSMTALGGVSIYFNTLWVSPTDPDFLVAGGLQLHKSVNGGTTFTQITAGNILTLSPSVQPHTDQHCVVSHPNFNGGTNKIVYVCNDGGVFRTNDITMASTSSGWERKELTYQTTQYYGVAGNAANNLIYGGTQDNGSLRLRSSNPTQADLPAEGDGGFAAIDPTNPSYCYGEYQNLQIHRFSDCTQPITQFSQFFTIIGGNPPNSDALTDAGDTTKSNFIAPFILDPNQPNRMLAGGRSLWRTDNARTGFLPSWFRIRDEGTANISAIAVAQGDSNIIWIAQNDGKVYKTDEGLDPNQTWDAVDDNGSADPFPEQLPTRILIDKDDHQTVYIAFGGFTNGNLQKTTNSGSSWTDITGSGLPNVPIRGIARHPNNANKLYIGTEIGVFTTDNGGNTWNAVLDGPANVLVDEVVFMSNSTKLLAATHGRGVWMTDVDDATITDHALFDFDADGRTDFSVFRPSNGTWYLERSREVFLGFQFGQAGDKPVARDYDGDGKADITVWRASDGDWYRTNSSNGAFVAVHFGQNGDVPVPADFDDDGKADQAVFRPSDDGHWYLNQSTAGFASIDWGVSTDIPSAADFDGDDKADLAVFRPSNGTWYILRSTNGTLLSIQFGTNGDIPVAADYDGDGQADTAVFRPSVGDWYLNRTTAGFLGVQYGSATDKLVPGDYDGDGKADVAFWRPSDGKWYLLQSTNGQRVVQFGANGDIPVPAVP